jgi:hypothetical protein
MAYAFSGIIVTRTLSSRVELVDFWSKAFGPSGGVMGTLLAENPNWPRPEYYYCRAVISAEYATFVKMRNLAFVTLVTFGALWAWLSFHYSFWVVLWFIVTIVVSAGANQNKGVKPTLDNIFRATRLWMWVDPDSLAQESPAIHLTELVEVLAELETIPNPQY